MKGLSTLSPELQFTDDVLSHLVVDTIFSNSSNDNGKLRFRILPNPSHLEAATPVGAGFARALAMEAIRNGKDLRLGDSVLSLSMHGDAAFAGQGVVYETLALPVQSESFDVGGTVRIIVSMSFHPFRTKLTGAARSGQQQDWIYSRDWHSRQSTLHHGSRKDIIADISCQRRSDRRRVSGGVSRLRVPEVSSPMPRVACR